MKRSSQRRVKRWILEEPTRRLDQRNEIHSNQTRILGPHGSGLRRPQQKAQLRITCDRCRSQRSRCHNCDGPWNGWFLIADEAGAIPFL